MEIAPQIDDEPEYVKLVEMAVNGVLRRHLPASLALIKIDNWFGSRWLGFSGKYLGAIGLTIKPSYFDQENLRIPPFVPDRVLSQRRFIGPTFVEVNTGPPVHLKVASSTGLRRKAAIEEPRTALAWYSGNSKQNGRGSLMVYLPEGSSYWGWFVEWERSTPWRVTESKGITLEEVSLLMEEGSVSFASSPTL